MALLAPWQSPVSAQTSLARACPPDARRDEPGTPAAAPGSPPRPGAAAQTVGDEAPEWWPYAPEFPHWHVWRGVAGLLYARRPRSSPPKVARAKDPATLRERIISAEVART